MFNVILPTYNEAGCIATVINMLDAAFKELGAAYTVIVVDSNSPDNTSGIVRAMGNRNVVVVDFPEMGLGAAYLAGLGRCTHPYTVILDSDLQHDPFAVVDMYRMAKKGYDIVSGTRYAGGGKVCNWSFGRRMVSCGANNLARYVLGLNTLDLTGSFRMYKTDVLRRLMPSVRCMRFGFQMEMIARAEMAGMAIAECPIVFYTRKTGESKISWREVVHFLLAVASLYFSE